MQWQHPGHPTASPSVSNQLGNVITEELIDIDSVLGNTKIKTSTTSTGTSSTNSNSSSSSSGASGTKRSAVEQQDNEQKTKGDDNKIRPVDTTKDSEQDHPSPSTVAADYLDYVLWWVDQITPEWIKEYLQPSYLSLVNE
ncbi:MAG: hypothetical protein EOP33_03255 [Rickettsiaceae bacterium]|nr:MAG: hypothetical protein EOP33_03255 [Rickettsiaceae bacterium]